MKIPILICIPFWSGDQSQAIDLCRILVGLQSNHAGQLAHVMLIARQDCKMDQNMVKIISAKFNTFTFKSPSPLRGWPSGPNGMFGTTMIHISNNFSKNYEVVYWMEPDCTAIRPNWFWDLVLEWRKRHPSARVVGCRSDCNGNGTGDHITGCALYDPDIARIMPAITRCDGLAWDYALRDKIIAVGGNTNLIQNRYKQTRLPASVIEEPGVCIIHGVKCRSVVNAVARKYNIKLS